MGVMWGKMADIRGRKQGIDGGRIENQGNVVIIFELRIFKLLRKKCWKIQ